MQNPAVSFIRSPQLTPWHPSTLFCHTVSHAPFQLPMFPLFHVHLHSCFERSKPSGLHYFHTFCYFCTAGVSDCIEKAMRIFDSPRCKDVKKVYQVCASKNEAYGEKRSAIPSGSKWGGDAVQRRDGMGCKCYICTEDAKKRTIYRRLFPSGTDQR